VTTKHLAYTNLFQLSQTMVGWNLTSLFSTNMAILETKMSGVESYPLTQ